MEGVSSPDPKVVVNSLEAYEPLWNLLPTLKGQYAMCCINNGPKDTIPYFEARFGLSRYMPFYNSGEEGISKPDPEIYIRACKRINVDPSVVIYLDDGHPDLPEETVKLGMHYIYWANPETGFQKFREALEHHDQ